MSVRASLPSARSSTARGVDDLTLHIRRPASARRARRAIVREPSVFLMDEPLSNLDAKLRVETLKLQRRLGTTTMYVTVEAMTMGDRIAVMNRGVLQQVRRARRGHRVPRRRATRPPGAKRHDDAREAPCRAPNRERQRARVRGPARQDVPVRPPDGGALGLRARVARAPAAALPLQEEANVVPTADCRASPGRATFDADGHADRRTRCVGGRPCSGSAMRISTGSLAAAGARHPWRTISAWIAVTALAVALVVVFLGGSLTTEGAPTNNPESERADAVRFAAFPPDPSTAVTDVVVIRSDDYAVDAPQFRAYVRDFVANDEVTALGRARTYLDGVRRGLVSHDRHATIVPIALWDDDETEALVETVQGLDEGQPFTVSVTGDETLDYDFDLLSQEDLENGELKFGLPAALIVLLLVFGAVVAGLVPLLMAMVSIVVALGLTALVAQQFELSVFVVNMLTGMGLALGIDYSLFVVSRYREERGRGRDQLAAIEASGATASRAVLFSGSVFVVAMLGMLLVPNSIMRSLAVGAILVGIVSVIAALTLLPAVLGLLGDKVDALRLPLVGRRSLEASNPEGRFWGAIVRRVLSRPALSLALSVAVLVVLALPVFQMEVGTSGVSALPDRFASKAGFLALERDFPATSTDPVDIVVPNASATRVRAALAELRSELAADRRFGAGELERSADRAVALLSVPTPGDPASTAATDAVRELRDEIIPKTFA